MPLEPGSIVGGDFRLVSLLREGGMGSVWIAEQISVGRRRALKVVRGEAAHDEKARERFAFEAVAGAHIDSEHVVEVVAAGFDAQHAVPWLAMELLEGSDLGEVLAARGALPRAEVRAIVAQLCHALAAAHAASIVHRDLKPENVFLARARRQGSAPFEVKLLDLGLARVTADVRATTRHALSMGTALYVAPEQTVVGGSATPGIDVWALGLVVYRMITGKAFWRSPAADGRTVTDVMHEIVRDPIPPASERAAEDGVGDLLPPGFDEWLARCLQREPGARFAEAGAAYVALEPLLEAPSIVPQPPAASHSSLPPTQHTPSRPAEAPASTPPSQPPSQPSSKPPSQPARPATPPAAPVVLEELVVDPGVKVARAGRLVLIRWLATPDYDKLARLDRGLERAFGGRGDRTFGVLPVVDAANPLPEGAVRDKLARLIARHDGSISAAAYVVHGGGFQAAALRGVITGLMLVARSRHPTKVFGTVAGAVAWLAARLEAARGFGGERADLAERVQATEELVARIERFCAPWRG